MAPFNMLKLWKDWDNTSRAYVNGPRVRGANLCWTNIGDDYLFLILKRVDEEEVLSRM
jgi:hypothetical protein